MRAIRIGLVAVMLVGVAALPGVGGAGTSGAAMTWDRQLGQEAPLVIGHRGACGYRPEHTLASYALAIELGADFIEPDLVMTKDGVLIARHENELSLTTDAATKFLDRKTKKVVDGKEIEGWFSEDFIPAEIKTLRAKEGRAKRSTAWDGLYEIPTFVEVIELAKRRSAELGHPIGLYPETKHPTYFDSIGLSLEEPLVATLKQYGLDAKDSPVIIQSFETQNLKALNGMIEVRLVQLLDDFPERPYPGGQGRPAYRQRHADAGRAEGDRRLCGRHRALETHDRARERRQDVETREQRDRRCTRRRAFRPRLHVSRRAGHPGARL